MMMTFVFQMIFSQVWGQSNCACDNLFDCKLQDQSLSCNFTQINNDQNSLLDMNNSYLDLLIFSNNEQFQEYSINISNITMNSSGLIIFVISDNPLKERINFNINGQSIYVWGGFLSSGTTNLIINTNEVYFNLSDITFPKFGIYGNNIYISGTAIKSNQSVCKGQCSCNDYSTCNVETIKRNEYPSIQKVLTNNYTNFHNYSINEQILKEVLVLKDLLDINFTMVIIAKELLNFTQYSSMKGSYIGIYGNQIIMNFSSIDTNGWGCDCNLGLGCGFLDWIIGLRLQCGGTGASHGGIGGFSSSQKSSYITKCLQMKSRQIYDSPFDPVFEGSGGGAQLVNKYLQNGRGGGVIYLESTNLTLMHSNLDSEGQSFIENIYYGSGSGGTIQIRTFNLSGMNTSFISVRGGGAVKNQIGNSYGGVGGGGRILLMLHGTQQQDYSITITADHGDASINMMNLSQKMEYNWVQSSGSIITLPCLQGQELNSSEYFCKQCPNGYFKLLSNFGPCQKCINFYGNGQYNTYNTPFCNLSSCGSEKKRNYECMDKYDNFITYVGGDVGVFATLYFIALLFINIIIVWCKRQKSFYRENKLNSQSTLYYDELKLLQQREQSSATQHFTSQDLAYHEKRIYIQGNNMYNQPWYIEIQTDQEFPLENHEELEQLFVNFNQMAQFTLIERNILIFLRYYYYPLYLVVLKHIQINKYKKLTNFLKERKAYIFNTEETGGFFKFSSSLDYTLAFLDVLNYKQDPLEWSSISSFPVCLVLSGFGTFMYPFQINLKDPIIKNLWNLFAIQPENDYEEIDESNHINCLENFVINFNYFAKLIDFRQSNNSFIKHFVTLVKFTDKQNKDVFKQQIKYKIQVDLCIHIISKTNDNVSRLIMLSLENKRDLEQCLSEIHNLSNFSDEYSIKFSINFDRITSEQIFDEQIVIQTKNNINQQIEEYKKYEDQKELLQNLKNKYRRRLDDGNEDQEQDDKKGKYAFSYKTIDNFSILKDKQKKEEKTVSKDFKQCYFKFKRGCSWFASQLTRFRQTKKSTKLLQIILIVLTLIQWMLSTIYPIVIISQVGQLQIGFLGSEIVIQLIVFPLAEITSVTLLTIWLLNSSRTIGKYYLMFNICGILSALIEFIFGLVETFSQINQGWELNLIKIFQLFAMLISSHLMCLQMNNYELEYIK